MLDVELFRSKTPIPGVQAGLLMPCSSVGEMEERFDWVIENMKSVPDAKFMYSRYCEIINNEEERSKKYHLCGSAGCIAGWMTNFAPEIFRFDPEDGSSILSLASPNQADKFAAWLGIHPSNSDIIIEPWILTWQINDYEAYVTNDDYVVPDADAKTEEVIDWLKYLKQKIKKINENNIDPDLTFVYLDEEDLV